MLGRVSYLGRVKKGKYQVMQSRLVVWECWYRVVQFSVSSLAFPPLSIYVNILCFEVRLLLGCTDQFLSAFFCPSTLTDLLNLQPPPPPLLQPLVFFASHSFCSGLLLKTENINKLCSIPWW